MIDKKSRRDKRGLAIRVGAIFLVLALLLGMVISAIPAFAGPARPDPKDKFEMEIQMLEDEQAANEMRQIYLSCPPVARKALLNSTRVLANELKDMVQTAEPVSNVDTKNK